MCEPWARVPLWWIAVIDEHLSAVEDKRNSVSAFSMLRVALTLSARAGGKQDVWPSQERIASEAGVKIRTVRRALTALEQAGIITKRRRQRESAIYTLILDRPTSGISNEGVDGSTNGCAIASEPLERSHSGTSNTSFDRPKCNLDRPHSDHLERPLYGRLTENTEQITLNNKRSVRGAMREKEVTPSDTLVEALLPYTSDGSYRTAYREAQQALKTLGPRMEGALITALTNPKTANARKPIGFAISAVQRHGGVLSAKAIRDSVPREMHGYDLDGNKCAAVRGQEPNGWSTIPPRGRRMSDLWPEHKNHGADFVPPGSPEWHEMAKGL